MGIILTVAALAAGWHFGRRSLGAGMSAVLIAGYFYGIVRANSLDRFCYFMYDAAVFGLYLARLTLPNAFAPLYAKGLTLWVRLLIGWPTVMFALCALFPQHALIQLVGLRSAIWYIPFLLLGASARLEDLTLVARIVAVLNIAALAFAAGEYFLGLETFYPKNDVTALIYRCGDVAGNSTYRIPATFNSAAAYGGAMAATIPLLIGRWQAFRLAGYERWLFGAALLSAALGTFLCASRVPVILLFVQGAFIAYYLRTRMRYLVPALIISLVVAYIVSGSDRLQRFTTLQDTDYIAERIHVSMNVQLLDLVLEYPFGAGLGSAFGTNIPTFLLHLVEKPPLRAENEYVRIGVEQGLVGMAAWLAFLTWLLLRHRVVPSRDWLLGCKMMLVYSFLSWGTAILGCGLLASIPSTVLILFQMGIIARDRPFPVAVRQPNRGEAGPCLLPG